MREKMLRQLLFCLSMVLVAALSFCVLADRATSLESYRTILSSIDEKSETVLKLTAASTLASAGVSAIPGDTATPIAEKLADFTEYFLLILCVLFAEKYLLTIIGAAVFKVLVPCACLLLVTGVFWNPPVMRRLSLRVASFALMLFIAIPASIRVSDMVYGTYRQSIDAVVLETEQLHEETSPFSGAGEDESVLSGLLERLTETASELADHAAALLKRYVESLAVLIVTSCIIPLLTLAFFLWLIKLLTGISVFGEAPPLTSKHRTSDRKNTEAVT